MKLHHIVAVGLCAFALAAGEVPPDKQRPCFPGAYYRKAVSSQDVWTGFEGIVTLPTPIYDESRRDPVSTKYLDNASIYVGGRAGSQEVDCGVNWEVIREKDGSVSKIGKAFRPFWRANAWNSGPAEPRYYFHPGDVLRIRLETRAANKLTMTIDVVERATDRPRPPRPKVSGASFAPLEPLESFTTTFDAPGFGPGKVQEFKRVNAIDQRGNEGKPVQPTKAIIRGAVWREVSLLRGAEKLPMTPQRYTDMRCPSKDHFTVTQAQGDPTSEAIDIFGTPPAR